MCDNNSINGGRQNGKSAVNNFKHRANLKPDGFDFDMETLEDLIDSFIDKKKIPMLLRCEWGTLDEFCKICYGMDFNSTYAYLSGMADFYMRRAFKNLAASGNATAQNIVSKYIMRLEDENAQDKVVKIQFVNDLSPDEEGAD